MIPIIGLIVFVVLTGLYFFIRRNDYYNTQSYCPLHEGVKDCNYRFKSFSMSYSYNQILAVKSCEYCKDDEIDSYSYKGLLRELLKDYDMTEEEALFIVREIRRKEDIENKSLELLKRRFKIAEGA